MYMQIPYFLLMDDTVQSVVLTAVLIGMAWLIRRSIQQSNQLAALTAIITNHYTHRFAQLSKLLGVKWEDEDQ